MSAICQWPTSETISLRAYLVLCPAFDLINASPIEEWVNGRCRETTPDRDMLHSLIQTAAH